MRYRYVFVTIAVVLGVACVRLGLWQLDRRQERRAYNASVADRARHRPVDITMLAGDTTASRFRRARVTGVADYAHEIVLGNRSRSGAPGVNLLTPVRIPGRDTAVLVNRGWVYSPDAATPVAGVWAESDSVAFEGYADILAPGAPSPANARRPRLVTRAVLADVQARVPYPVSPVYLVAQLPADSARQGVPARLALPTVSDEGPHMGYALQWFTFAAIGFIGAGIALRSGR